MGGSQWGMCPGGWKRAYEGMIRSIATWGAELGWRGQKQAAVPGSQEGNGDSTRDIGRKGESDGGGGENPAKLGDIMSVGFGDAGGLLFSGGG